MADQSAKWQQDQRDKAKAHKPKVKTSQIPGNYGCAGDCTESTPPAPGGHLEMFRVYDSIHQENSKLFWLVVGAAAAVYLALTLSKPNIAIRYR
jgi:hypothetical protein